MYVVESPVITQDVAQRAELSCRGSRQREWTWHMLRPGLDAEFRGRWSSSTSEAFARFRRTLAKAGIKTEELPLGYQGKPLMYITGGLSPSERELWTCHALDDWALGHCLRALADGRLFDVERVRSLSRLVAAGVSWRVALDHMSGDAEPVDAPAAALAAELCRTGLSLAEALAAARLAVSL